MLLNQTLSTSEQRTGASGTCKDLCHLRNDQVFRGIWLGGRTWVRTKDPLIKSQLLYQLSYASISHFGQSPNQIDQARRCI